MPLFSDMHDPANNKEFVCELCGNFYARATGLKQHMMSQHSDQVIRLNILVGLVMLV